jgi:hypothetical protein
VFSVVSFLGVFLGVTRRQIFPLISPNLATLVSRPHLDDGDVFVEGVVLPVQLGEDLGAAVEGAAAHSDVGAGADFMKPFRPKFAGKNLEGSNVNL